MSSINPLAGQLPSLPLSSTPQSTPAAQQGTLPMTGLASPYDGTMPTTLGTVGPTGQYGVGAGGVPQLTGLTGNTGSSGRQVNATNQTAIAPNGNVNQSVINDNQYTNKYYNIIVPNGAIGGWGGLTSGLGNMFGLGASTPGNSFIDPQTGVLYVQKDTGITGWFKRLFSGY